MLNDVRQLPSGIRLYGRESFGCLKRAGALLSSIMERVCREAVPGNTTKNLHDYFVYLMRKSGAESVCFGAGNFPFHGCFSNNGALVHGFPDDTPLREGDVLSVDLSLKLDGYCSDAARTVIVGDIISPHDDLVRRAEECFFAGLGQVREGAATGDIGHAVQKALFAPKPDFSLDDRFTVVAAFQGHGIGLKMHEPPGIMNIGYPSCGTELRTGMCFTVEPVITYKSSAVIEFEKNGCMQFRTSDGRPSAHYENTIFLTDSGPEVLTLCTIDQTSEV